MMFKTHIAVSILVAMVLFPIFSLDKGFFLLIFLFGALLPDIDIHTSFIGKRIKVVGWIFKHRGLFHSVFMLIILSGILWIFDMTYAIVFAMGYFTHLVLDMQTHKGLTLFYPLRFRIKGFIKTNGITENIIFLISLITGFIILIK